MPEEVAGEAAVHDPEIVVADESPMGAEPVAGQEDPRKELEDAVAAAQAKVDRQKEHLAGAEAALNDAKAALEAHGGQE